MTESKHSPETVRHQLQLEEHLEHHKQGWIIQKIGWVVLYAGLILALAGIFGTGPLSYRTESRTESV